MGDALKKLRKSFDQLIIVILRNSRPPLHRVSNPWNPDSQMPGQFCERDDQFSDGPKAKKTPGLGGSSGGGEKRPLGGGAHLLL